MTTTAEPLVKVTSQAADKIKAILQEQGTPQAALRVIVAGGGCSGFQYLMTLEENPKEDDTAIEIQGVKVVIDPQSAPYMVGASIDYVEGLMKSGFTIDNPNAVSSCACGSSFNTAEGGGQARACGH
ncbi:MAG: iron-sulfur cluster insertion protein ErpA [Chloroflexi bacterium]|nr:iron-sulfur cluster insertion protein ErpA [Chloroflexota bacterium]